MKPVRVAVVGAGAFGRHHLRVVRSSPRAALAAVVETDRERAAAAAQEYGCPALTDPRDLAGIADAAIVAVPTTGHAAVGCALLDSGLDLLVEKPIASSNEEARRLVDAAARNGRILQVGHLERFNPAVIALRRAVTLPLFFEIHRLSVFTPRSLDVDVVLDLMIHDLDLVLALTGAAPEEVRAAGISILSPKVDIANVRLAFANGCVANLTASRVSTEKVRKMRLFQPGQYLSIDYTRQDGMAISVSPSHQVSFAPLAVAKDEPLRLQFEAFLDAVERRARPSPDGEEAARALQVALGILDKIEEHRQIVAAATGLGGVASSQ